MDGEQELKIQIAHLESAIARRKAQMDANNHAASGDDDYDADTEANDAVAAGVNDATLGTLRVPFKSNAHLNRRGPARIVPERLDKLQAQRQQRAQADPEARPKARGPSSSTKRELGKPFLPPEYKIGGVRFYLAAGDEKLLRIPDDKTKHLPTPLIANVGGIIFLRDAIGDLNRKPFFQLGDIFPHKEDKMEPCFHFTALGSCHRGRDCPFVHDPSKVAICRTFLTTGDCPLGDACDLSHQLHPSRVSPCVYFQRDACTKAGCRFPHVKMDPAAPVCEPFARLGYCQLAAGCPGRHVNECPDHVNNGVCHSKRCRLPHPDRAAALRKRSFAAAFGDGKATKDGNNGKAESSGEKKKHEPEPLSDLDKELLALAGEGSDDGDDISGQKDYIKL